MLLGSQPQRSPIVSFDLLLVAVLSYDRHLVAISSDLMPAE
ncbi:hypothetical protein TIFTF001_031041 [Ficus carica]|uniref:Uncharacterized protein n=1 Tax=Ficus carica TaxID=3494 RepID=A0AA88J4Z2_FICCA|nr:hypothetical protein TIFTF001_031041 [Ficus carica]